MVQPPLGVATSRTAARPTRGCTTRRGYGRSGRSTATPPRVARRSRSHAWSCSRGMDKAPAHHPQGSPGCLLADPPAQHPRSAEAMVGKTGQRSSDRGSGLPLVASGTSDDRGSRANSRVAHLPAASALPVVAGSPEVVAGGWLSLRAALLPVRASASARCLFVQSILRSITHEPGSMIGHPCQSVSRSLEVSKLLRLISRMRPSVAKLERRQPGTVARADHNRPLRIHAGSRASGLAVPPLRATCVLRRQRRHGQYRPAPTLRATPDGPARARRDPWVGIGDGSGGWRGSRWRHLQHHLPRRPRRSRP